MKKTLLLILILSGITYSSHANEGLWLPIYIEKLNEFEMQFMGSKLSARQIYNEDSASVSDAIVSFGGYCTGEIISPQGLLLTNHHCGYESIQQLSLEGENYLVNGYWASENSKEIPVEGLFVRILKKMEDVTDQIVDSATMALPRSERGKVMAERIKSIEKEAGKDTHYKVQVKSYFEGNEYFLLFYEQFDDIRFVGTPPESVGNFGGETDNWEWPRHTGDFSMFRIYTAADGKPSEYSKDNIPYKAPYHLPISLKGIHEGDFAFSMGYPGSTNRYLSSFGVNHELQIVGPSTVKTRAAKLNIIKPAMARDENLYLKYSDKYESISNYYKFYIGQSKSLKRMNVVDQKLTEEKKFRDWATRIPETKERFGFVLDSLESSYRSLAKYESQRYYFNEAFITGAEAMNMCYYYYRKLYSMLSDKETGKEEMKAFISEVREAAGEAFKLWDQDTEIRLYAAAFSVYTEKFNASELAPVFNEIDKKYQADFYKYAKDVYANSILTDAGRLNRFLDNPSVKKLDNDPLYHAFNSVYTHYSNGAGKESRKIRNDINEYERIYFEGMRKMYTLKNFYPNANSTLRLVYGTISSYAPADAIQYDWKTTGDGILEKRDNSYPDYVVPDELFHLLSNRDFGEYGVNDTLPVCFIHTCDQTGGSSGSPVINGAGELIGISFDSNWEAMSGDIAYDIKYKRSIATDIRYVMFLIDKLGGAGALLREMDIRKP